MCFYCNVILPFTFHKSNNSVNLYVNDLYIDMIYYIYYTIGYISSGYTGTKCILYSLYFKGWNQI